MDWLVLIYTIAALASALAAVLAWAAKLWWAREFGAAKDEIIRAKDAQIELLKSEIQNLKELTPMKIREYFTSVKVQLEEYNELLQRQLNEAQENIRQKDAAIAAATLIHSHNTHNTRNLLLDMQNEKIDLERRAVTLQDELERVKSEMNTSKKLFDVIADLEGQIVRLPNGIFVKASRDLTRFRQGWIEFDPASISPLDEVIDSPKEEH